jgi:predicted lipoprotein
MRNLRNRVSALALAVIMAAGMATIFSTPVSAFDGFSRPSNEQICAALDRAEESLAYVTNAYLRALLQKAIDAAQDRYSCQ